MTEIPCMPLLYVAGPFRGPALSSTHPISRNSWIMESNCRRAETLALKLWGMGASVICPHANTRYFQNSLPDETWLNGDLAQIARCDGVVLTLDWQDSEGARHEKEFAESLVIPVFYEHSLLFVAGFIADWKACKTKVTLERDRVWRAR